MVDLLLLIEKRVDSLLHSLVKCTARTQPLLVQAKIFEDRARRQEEGSSHARERERQSILGRRSKRLCIRAEILRERATQALKISQSLDTLRQHNSRHSFLIRKDAKFGVAENSTFLIELEYNFLLKGYSHPAPILARNQ